MVGYLTLFSYYISFSYCVLYLLYFKLCHSVEEIFFPIFHPSNVNEWFFWSNVCSNKPKQRINFSRFMHKPETKLTTYNCDAANSKIKIRILNNNFTTLSLWFLKLGKILRLAVARGKSIPIRMMKIGKTNKRKIIIFRISKEYWKSGLD